MQFNSVKECLQYLLTRIKALEPIDSSTIKWSKTNQGIQANLVQDKIGGGSGHSPQAPIMVDTDEEEDFPFKVTILPPKDEGQKEVYARISGGWANFNGNFKQIPLVEEFELKEGYLCLNWEISEGVFTEPIFRFATPSVMDYPIAYVTDVTSEGASSRARKSYHIRHFYPAVAFFLVTEVCPMAVSSVGVVGYQ